MKRKNFISLMGAGAGSIIISSCLGACGKSDTGLPSPNLTPNPTPVNKLDFSFDVSNDTNITNRGWTIMNGVIIAKNGADFIALEGACPHAGYAMTYQTGMNIFPCSLQDAAHGSAFDFNGVKLRGPAPRNLKKYNTSLNGNTLRVYES
ncbi:MAG: Rieske 2Fe-2S domain-containing protein [Daejeonella sp.]